ncbi:MAG TPA: DUF2799 domain-containing protein [Pseudomonadales bacterium]
MRRIVTAVTAGALLALGGCASLSKSQCLADDWETVGYRDGANGVSSSALMRHQNACVKHGVTPDREAYLAGWRNGVEQYCQPANGFAVGEAGGGFSNVCPPRLQEAFHAAWQDGRRLHVARAELNATYQAIDQRERRLREVKAELADIAAGMLEADATVADRAALLVTAKDLAEEQGRLTSEIEELTAEAAVREERLAQLEQTLAYAH